METAQFAATLSARLAGYGTRPFIEFGHRWYTGDEVTSAADRISALLNEGGLAPGDPVGVVVRNRLPHAAAILGFVAARRPVVMIYSYQSARSIARDIADLALPAVVLDREQEAALRRAFDADDTSTP